MVAELEAALLDRYVFFSGFRICHHSGTACRGVFGTGTRISFRLAKSRKRLRLVRFVEHDQIERQTKTLDGCARER